jgi:hypothetical protein
MMSYHILIVVGNQRLKTQCINGSKLTRPRGSQEDIDEYVSYYSATRGMRVKFEYYRELFDDIKQNKEYSMVKLQMPVLAEW